MKQTFKIRISNGFWQNGSHLSGFQMVGLPDFRSNSKSRPITKLTSFWLFKLWTSPDFRSQLFSALRLFPDHCFPDRRFPDRPFPNHKQLPLPYIASTTYTNPGHKVDLHVPRPVHRVTVAVVLKCYLLCTGQGNCRLGNLTSLWIGRGTLYLYELFVECV